MPLVIKTHGKSKLKPNTGSLRIKKAKTFFPIKEQPKISFPGVPPPSSSKVKSNDTELPNKKVISTNILSFFKVPLKCSNQVEKQNINLFGESPFALDSSVKSCSNQSMTSVSSNSSVPVFDKYDVSTYREKAKNINDKELLDLINNVFVPDESFSYHKEQSKPRRRFRHDC